MFRGSEREKMNIYQISPEHIHWFASFYTLIFVYFLGPPLFLQRQLNAIIWHPKSAVDVARKAVYTTTC